MMEKSELPEPLQTAAAIDIGSNLIRMVIAEVGADGSIRTIDTLQRTVRLGHDTYLRGQLSGKTIRAAVAVLRDYKRLIDFYQVRHIRAVATSAVREAANSDTFLDRVFLATGLEVEVISTSEESRLTVSAVRNSMKKQFSKSKSSVLIVEVGGGSTLLTMLRGAEIVTSHSLPLGSIRLQEMLLTANEPPGRAAELLAARIENEIAGIESRFPIKKVETFVALGGDARFAAHRSGKSQLESNISEITAQSLKKLTNELREQGVEETAKRYGLTFADAETLKPALLMLRSLVKVFQCRKILVSPVSMRDGLLLDLGRRATGQEDTSLAEGVIHSATALAEKYREEMGHTLKVAELSVRLFDELQQEHGLNARHRLLLQAAALLHEVGDFISPRSHHKHSYYIITNSEIFGLTRQELSIVALTARYHRRSCPKPTHLEYVMLVHELRMIVNKLAAILRVADALDADHSQQIQILQCRKEEEEIRIIVTDAGDLRLARRSLALKGDLFQEIYGYSIRLESSAESGENKRL
jgi:exopolyphosphatase / guanosine-5'-triphosphate,3'-diphosphate pyrophosphatase